MAWDSEISKKTCSAADDGDVAEFKRLLRIHPSYLRFEDGSDYLMWVAAADNNLPILQTLVELGMDVNESHDSGDESDPTGGTNSACGNRR